MWVFPTNSDLIEPVCKIKIGHIFPLSFLIWLFSPIGRELNKICHAICSIFATHFIIQWTCFKQHEFRICCTLSEKFVLQRYHKVGHGLYLHWSWQTLMKIVYKDILWYVAYIFIYLQFEKYYLKTRCMDQAVHIFAEADAFLLMLLCCCWYWCFLLMLMHVSVLMLMLSTSVPMHGPSCTHLCWCWGKL